METIYTNNNKSEQIILKILSYCHKNNIKIQNITFQEMREALKAKPKNNV